MLLFKSVCKRDPAKRQRLLNKRTTSFNINCNVLSDRSEFATDTRCVRARRRRRRRLMVALCGCHRFIAVVTFNSDII